MLCGGKIARIDDGFMALGNKNDWNHLTREPVLALERDAPPLPALYRQLGLYERAGRRRCKGTLRECDKINDPRGKGGAPWQTG